MSWRGRNIQITRAKQKNFWPTNLRKKHFWTYLLTHSLFYSNIENTDFINFGDNLSKCLCTYDLFIMLLLSFNLRTLSWTVPWNICVTFRCHHPCPFSCFERNKIISIMWKNIFFISIFHLFIIVTGKHNGGNGTYKAAVFEHSLINPMETECSDTVCSREKAIELMELNLEVYRWAKAPHFKLYSYFC